MGFPFYSRFKNSTWFNSGLQSRVHCTIADIQVLLQNLQTLRNAQKLQKGGVCTVVESDEALGHAAKRLFTCEVSGFEVIVEDSRAVWAK